MRIIYTISKEEAEEIAKVRTTVKDKQTDKRLHAVELRGRGKSNHGIAEKLDTSAKVVSYWVSLYNMKKRKKSCHNSKKKLKKDK